jgi:hypothetical protein
MACNNDKFCTVGKLLVQCTKLNFCVVSSWGKYKYIQNFGGEACLKVPVQEHNIEIEACEVSSEDIFRVEWTWDAVQW